LFRGPGFRKLFDACVFGKQELWSTHSELIESGKNIGNVERFASCSKDSRSLEKRTQFGTLDKGSRVKRMES
jgi:hypothetical protein